MRPRYSDHGWLDNSAERAGAAWIISALAPVFHPTTFPWGRGKR
jgi:hypothetical protein